MRTTHARRVSLIAAAMAIVLASLVPALPAGEEKTEGDYRMTTYVVGFLYRGPTWTPEETPEIAKLQEAHLAHITSMVETGKLILAGPFMDDTDLRGLLVFKLEGETTEAMLAEAERMAAKDPMVKSGRLVLKFKPWYSAEGINIDQGK